MAHYIAKVKTQMNPDEAFAYMADIRNFVEWDPGVVRSVQVQGEGPGPEAVYDVTVDNGGKEMTLRYRVTDYEPSDWYQVVGKTALLTSTDIVRIASDGDGTVVTYDATLKLRFPLSLGDPILARVFDKIGDKAAAGLERALGGTLVS